MVHQEWVEIQEASNVLIVVKKDTWLETAKKKEDKVEVEVDEVEGDLIAIIVANQDIWLETAKKKENKVEAEEVEVEEVEGVHLIVIIAEKKGICQEIVHKVKGVDNRDLIEDHMQEDHVVINRNYDLTLNQCYLIYLHYAYIYNLINYLN